MGHRRADMELVHRVVLFCCCVLCFLLELYSFRCIACCLHDISSVDTSTLFSTLVFRLQVFRFIFTKCWSLKPQPYNWHNQCCQSRSKQILAPSAYGTWPTTYIALLKTFRAVLYLSWFHPSQFGRFNQISPHGDAMLGTNDTSNILFEVFLSGDWHVLLTGRLLSCAFAISML